MSILLKHSCIAILLGTGLSACENTVPQSDPLPYVYVNTNVFLNTAQALPLNTRDNTFIYIAGGLKGIIVYRKAPGNFVALERESPALKNCQVKVDPTQSYIVDTCSNSQFDFDGNLLSGASTANLRQYRVNFDGNKILITN